MTQMHVAPVGAAGRAAFRRRAGKSAVLAVLVAGVAFVAVGCEQTGQKQTIGAIGGAAVGGLLGSQFGGGKGQLVTTGIGVLLGVLAGSEIGRSMDELDRMKAAEAARQAQVAPIGQQITWNNPSSGNYGAVAAMRDGTSTDGYYCREFQQTITVAGKTENGYGVACRQPDGTWRIVK